MKKRFGAKPDENSLSKLDLIPEGTAPQFTTNLSANEVSQNALKIWRKMQNMGRKFDAKDHKRYISTRNCAKIQQEAAIFVDGKREVKWSFTRFPQEQRPFVPQERSPAPD